MKIKNVDLKTVDGFGDEWHRFDQSALSEVELRDLFRRYFRIFPWNQLPSEAEGFDMGCGSGRWARLVAPRVGRLHCIDPSSAIEIAKRNLAMQKNCFFHRASVGDDVLPESSMDFGYSLGVLHHVPDTLKGLCDCTRLLKPNAPFLLYLYYAMDNRSVVYRRLWQISELLRRIVSQLPYSARSAVSQLFAYFLYWPLSRFSALLERLGVPDKIVSSLPLSFYRHLSLYTMRTDALDRFGTRLEQRFTQGDIQSMMEKAGLINIEFSDDAPFWCAVGYRAP